MKFLNSMMLAGLVSLSAAQAQAQTPPVAASAGTASALDRIRDSGELRVCLTGDYKPFSFLRADGQFEGTDVDLAQSLATALKAKPRFVKTSWPTLLNDFTSGACDIAMGGISVTLDRQMRAGFSAPIMVDGKAPIVRCADVGKYASLAQIDRPEVRAIVNPGGTNERYAKANLKQAQIRVYPDNVTVFDEIVAGRADVMITDASETLMQHKLRPALCPVPLTTPLQYSEKAYLLPRDDVAFKAFVDQWLHLAKVTGEYDGVMDKWLK
ncbi:MAG: transporter substrate-binding domain-containing protein [Burkholderiaceae bacterium]